MLLSAHLHKAPLPSSLESIQRRVVSTYIYLATKLLKFVAESSNSIEPAICFIRAIKHADISNISPEQNVEIFNSRLEVCFEKDVFPHSQVTFFFMTRFLNNPINSSFKTQVSDKRNLKYKCNEMNLLSDRKTRQVNKFCSNVYHLPQLLR